MFAPLLRASQECCPQPEGHFPKHREARSGASLRIPNWRFPDRSSPFRIPNRCSPPTRVPIPFANCKVGACRVAIRIPKWQAGASEVPIPFAKRHAGASRTPVRIPKSRTGPPCQPRSVLIFNVLPRRATLPGFVIPSGSLWLAICASLRFRRCRLRQTRRSALLPPGCVVRDENERLPCPPGRTAETLSASSKQRAGVPALPSRPGLQNKEPGTKNSEEEFE